MALSTRKPLYPNTYVWFVLASALDVLLTFVVLWLGGREANALANWVLVNFGLVGFVVFKFAMVTVVVLVCEAVGRRQPTTGRRLAEWAVAITFVPVVLALLLIWLGA